MKIADLFKRPAAPTCVRCEGRSGHPVIDGDGTAICMPCILRNGRAAADPSRLTAGEAQMLLVAHGDVVSLVRFDIPGGPFWKWWWTSAGWPSGREIAQ
ncbi:MAG: hypothetical protein QOJ81_1333 [Chloroflexota bacterium]|jgi:hypothetical protein|nr:hypothetical protein [Chloroflexota bacterium]